MANEIALNLMIGKEECLYSVFMFTRSTGYHSGNWDDLEKAFARGLVDAHSVNMLDYYAGSPYVPIAGGCLLKWSYNWT